MSRTRGVTLQREFAHWLTSWWPHAESNGSGRQGRDVLGTPGVWWEVKTAGTENLRPAAWIRQATAGDKFGTELPVVVWFPPKVAMGSPGAVVAMLPLTCLMDLLEQAGYAPAPSPREVSA